MRPLRLTSYRNDLEILRIDLGGPVGGPIVTSPMTNLRSATSAPCRNSRAASRIWAQSLGEHIREAHKKNRRFGEAYDVTIIARKLRPTGDSFTIEDYQIVNGCQTTNVLFDQRASLDDSVTIPVRLINTKDEEIIKSITKATNRQTRVKPEQLFALQECPKALETYFASFEEQNRLYFERRDRQYDGVVSQGGIQQVRIISFADMIRALAAMFLNEPHKTTRNFGGLKAKVGAHIFAKDQRMDLYYTAAADISEHTRMR